MVPALKEFIKNHYRRVAAVVMVGGVGFVIQTLIFEIIGLRLALVAASTATLLGGELALLSNFFLNDRLSFGGEGRALSKLSRLVRFHIVASGSLGAQWLFVFVAEHITQNLLLLRGAYLSGIAVGFLINYSGYYLFVWQAHKRAVSLPKSNEDVQ